MSREPAPPRVASVLPAALLVVMLATTWRGWADVLVDFGMELYVPWRMAEGDALYGDLAWKNGPLSQLWHAFLFAVAGPSYGTIIASNIAVTVGVLLLIQRALGRALGAWAGITGGCVFAGAFACAQMLDTGNYNWLSPYRHELTHGVLLALSCTVACVRARMLGGRSAWLVTGILLGAVAMTKMETLLGALLGCAAVSMAATYEGPRRHFAQFALGAMVVPAGCLLVLSMRLPVADALVGILGNFRTLLQTTPMNAGLYRHVTGWDDPAGNGLRLLASLAAWMGVVVAWRRGRRVEVPAAMTVFCAVAGIALFPVAWEDMVRPLPLFLAWVMVRAWRSRSEARLFVLGWAATSLGLCLKMGLAVHTFHYGFALAMPGLVLVAALLLAFRRRPHAGTLLGAALCSALVARHVVATSMQHRARDVVVGSGGDVIVADNARRNPAGEALALAARDLASEIEPGRTLLMLPEGILLNYLLRVRSPLPYLAYTPYDLDAWGGEDVVLHAMQQHAPDFVGVIHRDVSESALKPFGLTDAYGGRTLAWIRANYEPFWNYGPDPTEAERPGMVVFRRRAGP